MKESEGYSVISPIFFLHEVFPIDFGEMTLNPSLCFTVMFHFSFTHALTLLLQVVIDGDTFTKR